MDIRQIEVAIDPHSYIWERFVTDDDEQDFELRIPPQQPTHVEFKRSEEHYKLGSHDRVRVTVTKVITNRPF